MASRQVVVVTGANRGIGLAICEQIISKYSPVKLYACSRAGKDLGLSHDSSSEVVYPKLDITEKSHVQDLASKIKAMDGHVNVLINNAGLNKANVNNLEQAEEIMNINYHGTLAMCQAFLPLVASQGRIVNLSSTASSLQAYSKTLQGKFRDSNLTLGDVDDLAKKYLDGFTAGNLNEWGNRPVYSASKACVNALTHVLARDNPNVFINCCCPGWVATDMGRIVGDPPKSEADGAKIPVRLGFGDIQGTTGKYWSNPGVFDTGEGQVLSW